MGITHLFGLFEYQNKLHIHIGVCCDGELKPFFISKDDVDYEYKNNPSNVTSSICSGIKLLELYKICHDDYAEIMDHLQSVLTENDFKYFRQRFNRFHGWNFIKMMERPDEYESEFSDYTYDE